MKKILRVVLLSLAATPAVAQNGIDPSIASVVTGGYWQDADQDGLFRIIVRRLDGEHVTSEVTVQWLALNSETMRYEIVKSKVVAPGGTWSFGQPALERAGGSSIEVTITGTNAYTNEVGFLRFQVGRPDEAIVFDVNSIGATDRTPDNNRLLPALATLAPEYPARAGGAG